MNNKKEIEDKAGEFLKNKPEIIFAYIFGSFVQSEYFHDIDIAVCLFENFNKNDFKKFPYGYESLLISELEQLLRNKIDFVVMNNAEILIQQRIINNGLLLFSKNESKRISYENYIQKLYIDCQHIRKIKNYYLAKKIIDA